VKVLKFIFIILLLSGCTTSYHNLNNGPNSLGGGFTDTKIHTGVYALIAKTNFAPWSDFSAAHNIFKRRATELCGSEQFSSIKIIEREYEHLPRALPPKYIISEVKGYIICETSKLTPSETEGIIESHELKMYNKPMKSDS